MAPFNPEFIRRAAREITGPRDLLEPIWGLLFDQLYQVDRLRERDLCLRTAADLLPMSGAWAQARELRALMVKIHSGAPASGTIRETLQYALRICRKPLSVRQIHRVLRADIA